MIRIFFIIIVLAPIIASAQWQRYAFTQPKMGSPFTIILYTSDSATANKAATAAFHIVDSMNAIFSDYDTHSELNGVSATAGTDHFVTVSPLLYQLILQSKKAWQQSGGAFDITIGALSKLWRTARKEKRFPSPEEVQAAKQKTGFENVLIDTLHHRIKLGPTGLQLDAGGIAKGFTAQQVIALLQASGITSALVDAGGDISCSNAPPGKEGWTIGVNIPEQTNELINRTIELHNRSVATSGYAYQYTLHNGKKYSHIIDPATGYGVTWQRNVTVIAADGATADWLASACSILPLQRAKRLVRSYKAELLVSEIKHKKLKFYSTKGFKQYWNKKLN